MTSPNLPAVAHQIGGALVKVLEWEQHALLPTTTKYAIAKFVQSDPSLNTEERVDFLADLASFHGQKLDEDIKRFTDDYGVEIVYLAIDYLYESGRRTRKEHSYEDVDISIHALASLALCGVNLTDSEQVDPLVIRLGGLERIADMDQETIIQSLEDQLFACSA